MTGRTKATVKKKPIVKKPTRPDRPEPIEQPSPPGREYQDPWFPDLSIQLYGTGMDFEIRPGDSADELALKAGVRDALQAAIGGALSAFLPAGVSPDIQFAFDGYPGVATPRTSLSIGFWLENLSDPNDTGAIAARRNGLLRLRKDGQRPNRGELTLRFGVIEEFLRRTLIALPGSLPADAPTITINSISITPGGSSVTISVFISTSLPVLGALHHLVEMRVDFGARAGNLTIGASNLLVSGDFLIDKVDASVLLLILMPRIGQFAPREIFMSGLKMTLDYSTPVVERRGTGQFLSGQQALVVPLGWTLGARRPAVSITGPRVVSITGSSKVAQYRAATTDMFSPQFTWKLNGRVQAGSGPTISITYRAGTQQPGTLKVARVEVTATEPAAPNEQRTASMTSTVRVIVVDV